VIAAQDGFAIELFSTDSPLRDATGDLDSMALYAGQSCSLINKVVSVEECITTLLAQANTALARLQLAR
jgi:nitronate monooxygenase